MYNNIEYMYNNNFAIEVIVGLANGYVACNTPRVSKTTNGCSPRNSNWFSICIALTVYGLPGEKTSRTVKTKVNRQVGRGDSNNHTLHLRL